MIIGILFSFIVVQFIKNCNRITCFFSCHGWKMTGHHLTNFFTKKLQICENHDLTENTFWPISLVIKDLQKRTITHFKGDFLINNFFACPKRVECVLEALQLKMLVQIILVHPLKYIDFRVKPVSGAISRYENPGWPFIAMQKLGWQGCVT